MAKAHKRYMQKIPDMSGSVAKNRFRVELLWGIEKLLSCLDEGLDDFSVVFDYYCDIELHVDDQFEFYQIKTSKGNNFGVSWVRRKQRGSNVSIVGKLYELHDAGEEGRVRLIIVGNKPFTHKGGPFQEPGELLFSALSETEKQKIEEAIVAHLPGIEPDISKISYIMVAMDLSSPDDPIRGHLINTYENTMGCEARKPNALYRALRGLAAEKACEEKQQPTYEDVIANKAITSAELKMLFDKYADMENSQYDFVMKWIDGQPPLRRPDYKCAYEEIIENLYKPTGSKMLRIGRNSLERLDKGLREDEIVSFVAEEIRKGCGPEITSEMCELYAVIALHAMIEGIKR